MQRFVVAVLVCALISACKAESRPQMYDPTDVRTAIDSANGKMMHWAGAGQADSIGSLFTQDVWQMPPNMAPLVGRDSLQSFWTNTLKTSKWQFDLKTDDVIVADSLAVERGHYTLNATALPGSPMPSFQDHGNYIAVWRHEPDGKWRVLYDAPVSTVQMPPAAPTSAKKGK
ncbi:MAG: DUF4440 domain-containing protein [Gemmatimonadaceae bacterium]